MNDESQYGLLRKIFDAMPSMVFVVDEDVRVYEFNKAAADFLTVDRSAILRHRGGEILHCLHSREAPQGCGHAPFCKGCVVRNSVKSASEGNRVVRVRTRMEVLRDGNNTELFVLITASPFSHDNQKLVLLVIEDISLITDLKRIIPICSICHRIRDKKATWSRIEAYFKDNWDVDFTHGLCPECYEKEMDKLINENKTEPNT